MTEPHVYGHTRSGRPITDEEVDALAAEAEAGYDVDDLIARRPKRGRPTLGSAPANVESVRLDPELRHELAELRAQRLQRSSAKRFAASCERRDGSLAPPTPVTHLYRGTTVTAQRTPGARPSRPSAVSRLQPRSSASATYEAS